MQASHSLATWDQDEFPGDVRSTPTRSPENRADCPVNSPLHPGDVQHTSNKPDVKLSQYTLPVSCSVSSSTFADKQTAESLSPLSLSLSIYLSPSCIHMFFMLRMYGTNNIKVLFEQKYFDMLEMSPREVQGSN